MASASADKTTAAAAVGATSSSSDFNGYSKADTPVCATDDNEKKMTVKPHHDEDETRAAPSDSTLVCQALRQQNDALRQELHDIRREMDEITDQFRTEDAEEFKQLQAELEIAAKNCRILQFKLRKAEKRTETVEAEKETLEEKIHQLTRDHYRVRDLEEELLIAKEVSVRLHSELEKSEESRGICEKFNRSLKQQLDLLKEALNEKSTNESQDDYYTWQLSVSLYEALFREHVLIEELTWFHTEANERHLQGKASSTRSPANTNGHEISDLMDSYQQKISLLNGEILQLKQDVQQRDQEIGQLHLQYRISKQRSRSAEKTSTSNEELSRSRRDGNLCEQLEASADEIRLLKNKLSRLEDDLNNSALEKETLLEKLDEQAKQGTDEDLRLFTEKIDHLIAFIKENKFNETLVRDLQQALRTSRWTKQLPDDQSAPSMLQMSQQTAAICQQANDFLLLLQSKHQTLDKIRYRLTNLTYDANDTCTLLEELDLSQQELEKKRNHCDELNNMLEHVRLTYEEKLQGEVLRNETLEKTLGELQQENLRLVATNGKQTQDLRHVEQLRQSIVIFEKKLDQKQTRVNELSMKIIEKEDIIETKVKECQKHRLELRELETKYYTLGKQLEEQIVGMTREMEKLNVEKEMLKFDLESVRLNQQHERPKSSAEDEITRVKAECRQQILDGEMESYKLRLHQSNHEKDELLKTVKDLEKKLKDLQVRFDANEQSWTRMKTETSEKQRKYDESIKLKSELQNAVDRLRQKLHELEMHNQDKQNKYNVDKQQWENQRMELIGKVNEFEEQLSKVTKRQRKDLDTVWKKERTDLQKQLQQSQQLIKDLQKPSINRETPQHLTEKINVLLTENELLLTKIKELEIVEDNVHLVKTEIQRLRDKNSSDWNYWRKQQSDLYAQLRQQTNVKESILYKFDRLQKQLKSGENGGGNRLVRDVSVGPLSLNSFQNEATTKSSLSNFSRDTFADEIDLPHGTIDGRAASASDIVGALDDSLLVSIHEQEKQRMFDKTYSAQENTAASIEEIASKIDRVEDHLFSYRRFMDFIRAKSEKSGSLVRDDSFTKTLNPSDSWATTKRLASLPPENLVDTPLTASQRRSRFDKNPTNSHDYLQTGDEQLSSDLMSTSMIAATANPSSTAGMSSSKNRFFSLSRRFRFRTQSPDKGGPTPASVHFLDEDIDLETKEPTTRKSDRPSKGILKTLRHRSPFRFRSKDAVIIEQEPSPPPPPVSLPSTPLVSPPAAAGGSKEVRAKVLPASTSTKTRGRLVELKKATPKSSTPNGSSRKPATPPVPAEPTGSTLLRRASGLKDLIHKFEPTPSSSRPKRVTTDANTSQFPSAESNTDEQMQKSTSYSELSVDDQSPRTPALNAATKSKTIDIPDLLRNVERNSPTATAGLPTRSTLRHSNSSRQTTSFDSSVSMVSASDSINTTNSSTRKPTSTARPLMLSVSKEEA